MTDLSPSIQEVLDSFKEKHPMLDDRTASIFISTTIRVIVKTHLKWDGEKFIDTEDLLIIAEDLEKVK